MGKIFVAIVEDEAEIRNGVAAFISESEDFVCAGCYQNGEDAFREIPKKHVDVVLMDIQMPKMDGIECIRKLKEANEDVQIMMLTVFEDEEKIFDSLKAGADGYLLKTTPPEKLLEAIRELYNGGSPMSGSIARKVINTFQTLPRSKDETEDLSNREREILSYCAKGYMYKEIAEALSISVETVRTHIHHIYEKLHVRSRTEAIIKYLKR